MTLFYHASANLPYRIALLGLLVTMPLMNAFAKDNYEQERQQMLAVVQHMVAATESYIGKTSLDPRVEQAIVTVPRHLFVPKASRTHAYENRALPISHNQTISQPYIVALMSDLAGLTPESVVLEVGTGSGYQAAVLSQLAAHVYSIEIVEPLGLKARSLLQQMNYENVTVKIGDGYHGWPEHAPFDAILVTAAPDHVPKQLIEQLKPGGRLVIPVGQHGRDQSLRVLMKTTDGQIEQRAILPVAFVPLTGDH